MNILFEDENLLAIDKPAGLVVNRSETTKGKTVQDWVESSIKLIKSEEQEFLDRSGIVHRLDKDTSGILLIAKKPESFENLKNQFKNREVIKKYLALVHGKIYPTSGCINAPIARSAFNRMHYGIFSGGREAVTDYNVVKEYGEYTLLELTPHTGRTHQIRVHMKYLNHPVVADPIYGGRKQSKKDMDFCPRLFLHATNLQIKLPFSGKLINFESPLPPDLQKVLDNLQ